MGKLISVAEYAEKHGKAKTSVIQKIQRGGFQTAQKIGNIYVIDEDEPYTDLRREGASKRWGKK